MMLRMMVMGQDGHVHLAPCPSCPALHVFRGKMDTAEKQRKLKMYGIFDIITHEDWKTIAWPT